MHTVTGSKKRPFLDNPDQQRASFINALAAAGVTIDLYRKNRLKLVRHVNIQIFPPVYGVDFWKSTPTLPRVFS